MNVYFSGISGTGIGPLAELAVDAGYEVFGSDLSEGHITEELEARGVKIHIGPQTGDFLRKVHEEHPIDWFVYTSSLPKDHAELVLARKLKIKVTKRDQFINEIVESHRQKLVAVAGTHGKTTTTSMIIWVCSQLKIPVSYLVGSTLPWGPAGKFDRDGCFFIYEADEYDRNFLNFYPWLTVITTETYDHVDTFPTEEEYHKAFSQFKQQSDHVITVADTMPMGGLDLVGELRRLDAQLAFAAVSLMALENDYKMAVKQSEIVEALNTFPGVGRRFEKIIDGVYSDYAHHPEEVAATLQMARELVDRDGHKGLVAVYEPHQNTRQHQVKEGYRDVFREADKVFWVPTFLTREDPKLSVLAPEDFIQGLSSSELATATVLDDSFAGVLKGLREEGYLIVLMTAGPGDGWLRRVFLR